MMVVAYSIFRVLRFPHEGKIITKYILSFCRNESIHATRTNIPLVGHLMMIFGKNGVGMYSTLMGTFNMPSHVLFVGSSSSTFVEKEAHVLVIQSFKTNYLDDPWVLLNPLDLREDCLYP